MAANPLLARLARDVNCLADADKGKRGRAVKAIATALFDAADVSLTAHRW